jgi:hypothetical protein
LKELTETAQKQYVDYFSALDRYVVEEREHKKLKD